MLMAAAALALVACARPEASPGGPGGSDPLTPPPPSAPSPGAPATGANLVPLGYDGRFRVVATVLESREHGPQLCHAVATSLPPQCGGPAVAGWDWGAVAHESVSGTRWGSYLVTGRWDAAANTLTLTEPAIAGDQVPESAWANDPVPDFSSPCPAPAGGWVPLDRARATDETMERAIAAARADPDFAGAWLDQSYLRESGGHGTGAENDPQRFVLNLRFTKDLPRHEREIRAIWGGALCLSRAERSLAELERIRATVTAELGQLSSNADEVTGVVEVTVTVATERDQARLDARFGAGVVVLNGWLRPID
jgi:hypothetical protein